MRGQDAPEPMKQRYRSRGFYDAPKEETLADPGSPGVQRDAFKVGHDQQHLGDLEAALGRVPWQVFALYIDPMKKLKP